MSIKPTGVVTATILSGDQRMDPTYELLSIDIVREVNRIPYTQLVLIDGEAAGQKFSISDNVFFEPGKEIEIKLRNENAPENEATVFKGLVVSQRIEAGDHGSLLTVELKDAAVRMTLNRNSWVYRECSDNEIVEKVVDGNGLKTGTLTKTEPTHPELVQYYCTDWDFILSRADARGLLLVVNDGELSLLEIAIKEAPKFTFEYGINEIFDFEIEVDAGRQYPAVESIAWDHKEQKLTKVVEAREFELPQGNLNGGDVARAVGIDTQTLRSPVPLKPDNLQAWADGTMVKSRMSLIRGRMSVPGIEAIKLLDVIEVAGVGERFNGQTLVTGIRHRVDQHGWQTDVQFGLSAERFAEKTNVVDAPAAGLLPGVNGLQVGIVDAYEEDPEKAYRVKVILPGIDEKEGSIWARQALPDAGKDRGFFFPTEPGDEVVVGFFNDDPRQAVILGAMHSPKNRWPESIRPPHKENYERGIISKKGVLLNFLDHPKASFSVITPEGKKILLDDELGWIQLTDQHGNDIIMNQDGIKIFSNKDLIIEGSGNVTIEGKKVDVK